MEKETLYGKQGIREVFFYGMNTENKAENEKMYQDFLRKHPEYQSHKPTAKDVAQIISDYFNTFSNVDEELIKEVNTDHRTLQQSFTKFVFKWIEHCASDDYGFDGRNEDSHIVAKKLIDYWKEHEEFPPSGYLRCI